MLEMTATFDKRLQEDMGGKYSLYITQAEAEYSQQHYSEAESICARVDAELVSADYFNKRSEIISKADDLEKG